jgi:hypothetical protein|tara:strand:+ start:9618 stop:9770 length:153 start_codon:yes stop_codon:yes gene_type:complete
MIPVVEIVFLLKKSFRNINLNIHNCEPGSPQATTVDDTSRETDAIGRGEL